MSDFEVPVVKIGTITKHPNADTLSITEVEGCPVIIRTTDFKEGDLAVYLPIESLIPEDKAWVKEFCSHLKFKNGIHRLKAVRLRKVFSMGMLVPILAAESTHPAAKEFGFTVGADVATLLGVEKYEEPEDRVREPAQARPRTLWGRIVGWIRRKLGLQKKVKPRLMPVYEVSHYRKSKQVLTLGEVIIATEKIHGCNAAISFANDRLNVSSHRVLRSVEDESRWWEAARRYNLRETLQKKPDHVFYGEIFGPGVQDMEYNIPGGQMGLRFFDVFDMKEKRYLDYDAACILLRDLGLIPVPEVYRGPYDPAVVEPLCDGKSLIADHFREGIVIRPEQERCHPSIGRVILKLVGQEYLLRKGGTELH
jgi:tRNA-binding EMAP/Myf-like protein